MRTSENQNGLTSTSSKTKRRRNASAVVAMVLVVAMLLSGTFAWNYYRDHKTNEAEVDAVKYKARLVEEYNPDDTKDWKFTDPPVAKTISVINPGAETAWDANIYGDIFVRIQLKEFMQWYRTGLVYTEERYMINTEGAFLSFPSEQAAEAYADALRTEIVNVGHVAKRLRMYFTPFATNAYLANAESIADIIHASLGTKYPLTSDDFIETNDPDYDFNDETTWVIKSSLTSSDGLDDDDLPWYIQTQEDDPNGVYGAFMVLYYISSDEGQSLVEDVAYAKPDQTDHHNDLINTILDLDPTDEPSKWEVLDSDAANGECQYTVHTWENGLDKFINAPFDKWADPDETFDKYIKWNYGPDVMTFDEWLLAGRPSNKWVVDSRNTGLDLNGNPIPASEEGWIYWVGYLQPGVYGQTPDPYITSTTDFLSSIYLLQQPEDAFYYAIHTDMQAVSYDQLYHWDDVPEEILAALVRDYVKVTRVTIGPTPYTIYQGEIKQLEAAVYGNVANGIPQGVIWGIASANYPDEVSINQKGELNVSSTYPRNEEIEVTATSKYDPSVVGTAVIRVVGTAYVEDVKIEPAAANVPKMIRASVADDASYASSQKFTADVDVQNASPTDPTEEEEASQVTWTVAPYYDNSAPLAAGTYIDADGMLYIGADETNRYLRVTATSDYNPDKFATAVVNVLQVTSVTITGAPSGRRNLTAGAPIASASIGQQNVDTSFTLYATVHDSVNNVVVPGGVTWSINPAVTGVSVDANGEVTIGAGVTAKEFTVRATSNYDTTKFGTLTVKVAQANITSIKAAFEADRFSIASYTSSSNTIKENTLSSSGTYRVASAGYETELSFVTTTVGTPVSGGTLNQAPVVEAKYSGSVNQTLVNQTLYPVGTEGTANNASRDPVPPPAGFFKVVIPAKFVGTITVTVQAAQDETKSVTFTLTVDSLLNTVKNRTAASSTNGKFFVDDVAWRVMSKTVGSTYSNGRGVLILSEHALTTAQWNDTTGAGTDYNHSTMRTVTLPAIYNTLNWAEDYAVLPRTNDGSWDRVGNSDDTNNTTNDGARVTTNYVPVDSSGEDGLFLLSYGERRDNNIYGLSNAQGASTSTLNRIQANLVDGTAVGNWLRGSNNYFAADLTSENNTARWLASHDPSARKTIVYGVRPAMILDFGANVATSN